MNLTQCANGHYYDMDKYSICPFCSGSGTGDRSASGYSPTIGMPTGSYGASYGGEDVTVGEVMTGSNVPQANMDIGGTGIGGSVQGPAGTGEPGQAPAPMAEDDTRTIGLINWEAVKENEKKRNEGVSVSMDEQRREVVNPVVGWLVCISGSNYGQSFTLHSGRNFIGRDMQQNDVGLTGDQAVSRVKHAIVIYEPRQRQFFVQSGENSHELLYLNDQGVFSNTVLKDRDIITLGQTSLVFVPFCDERYGWDVGKSE